MQLQSDFVQAGQAWQHGVSEGMPCFLSVGACHDTLTTLADLTHSCMPCRSRSTTASPTRAGLPATR